MQTFLVVLFSLTTIFGLYKCIKYNEKNGSWGKLIATVLGTMVSIGFLIAASIGAL